MKKILPRAAALLLCLTTLLSCASCVPVRPASNDPDAVYGNLLNEYAALVQSYHDGTDLSTVETPTAAGLTDELFQSLKIIIPAAHFQNVADMGYAFYDLDGNGTYECFLMDQNGILLALYADQNGSPYLVENYRAGTYYMGVLLDDGSIYTYHTTEKDGKNVKTETRFSRFEEGEMVPFRAYIVDHETDTAYAIEDGVQRDMSEKEKGHLNDVFSNFYYDPRPFAKESGLWFKSIAGLTEETTESGDTPDTVEAPEFDASSYEAILETLIAMMPTIRAYSNSDWLQGKYDDAMTVDSPEEFRTYINLLYACGTHAGFIDSDGNDRRRAIGYAYKDLNRDGKDELFILNEDSHLIALFTLKKGTPVMLWRACDGANAALDENGRLLATRYVYRDFMSAEYFVYRLNRKGELVTDEYMLGSQDFCKVMNHDGKVTVVDFETLQAKYNEIFKKNTDGLWYNEWNGDGKLLTFIPLPEADN